MQAPTRYIAPRHLAPLAFLLVAGPLAGCGEEAPRGSTETAGLTAACLDSAVLAEEAAPWVCGEAQTLECHAAVAAPVTTVYIDPTTWKDAAGADTPPVCSDDALVLNDTGPWAPGGHTIVVSRDVFGAVADVQLCQSELTVVDTLAPAVEPIELTLWPPNHDLITVFPEDCAAVVDLCDDAPEMTFTWAQSDEPENATGDGNTEHDIVDLHAHGVMLRAERQGGGDGRVYTLGLRVEDFAGHVVESSCRVQVPHDQGSGSSAIDSGPSFTHQVRVGD